MIGWGEAHESEDDAVEPPDRETVKRQMERLRGSRLTLPDPNAGRRTTKA